jgi:hypothetical protein
MNPIPYPCQTTFLPMPDHIFLTNYQELQATGGIRNEISLQNSFLLGATGKYATQIR